MTVARQAENALAEALRNLVTPDGTARFLDLSVAASEGRITITVPTDDLEAAYRALAAAGTEGANES